MGTSQSKGKGKTLGCAASKKGPSANAELLQCVVALREGNLDAIQKRMIDSGRDLNTPLLGGVTPLAVAAEEGHAPALRLLAAAGAALDVADDDGATACALAAKVRGGLACPGVTHTHSILLEGGGWTRL